MFNLMLTLEIQAYNDNCSSSSVFKNTFIFKALTEHIHVIRTEKAAKPKSTFILFNVSRALFYMTGKLYTSLYFWTNENKEQILPIWAIVVLHHILTHSNPNEFSLLKW